MKLKHKNIEIRLASTDNAEYLHKYRSESGETVTLDEVRESLNENKKQHMIELGGKIIGDIHYGDLENNTAEIGIFIRDENERGKGYGFLITSIYIDTLINVLKYDKIRIATSVDNKAMRHISEAKFGLSPIIHEDESYAEYILEKENWRNIFDYDVLTV